MKRLGLSELAVIATIYAFVIGFVFLPILVVALESLKGGQGLSAEHYVRFLSSPHHTRLIANSLLLAVLTTIACTAIALPLAYVLGRYDLKYKAVLRTLLLAPLVTPPFVTALALVNLFGLTGTFNIILVEWLKINSEPIDFLGGLPGLVFIEALHFFPLLMLNLEASIASISREVEEVAEVHGASGWTRFFQVTLPLAMPGWLTGSLLVFIFAFSDWVTPLILRQPWYLATEVYLAISENYGLDPVLYRSGLVGTILITLVTISSLVIVRRMIERRRYEVKGVGRLIRVRGLKRVASYIFIALIITIGLLPPIWIFLRSISKRWFLTAFPTEFTTEHYRHVLEDIGLPLWNSVGFAITALAMDLLLGVTIAYILTRTNLPGRWLLDSLVTFIIVIPGIVLGVGYLVSFTQPTLPLARNWFIMPLVIAVHRLPFVVRSSYAAFVSLDRSLEEVAYVLGASKKYTVAKITLPLTTRALVAGGLFMLVFGLQELSALMFLYRPGWETITISIFKLAMSGANFEGAAATGVVLILIVALFMALAFRLSERITSYQVR